MGAHLIDGEFQSDKYPTTPRGKVPLSVKDRDAQDLLWEYAQRRRRIDAEFADDLQAALIHAGFPRARAYSKDGGGELSNACFGAGEPFNPGSRPSQLAHRKCNGWCDTTRETECTCCCHAIETC